MKITKIDTLNTGAMIVYFSDGSALRTRKRDSTRDWDFFPGNVNKCLNGKETGDGFRDSAGKCSFAFNFQPSINSESWKYHYNKGFEPYKFNWDGSKDML